MTDTVDSTNRLNSSPVAAAPDPEVVPKAERRRYSKAYKLRVLEEADACIEPGEIGALLRREGLYSSALSRWRQQREDGNLDGKKRGRKADPAAAERDKLKAENERLRRELEKASLIIAAQKKLVEVFGLSIQVDEKP